MAHMALREKAHASQTTSWRPKELRSLDPHTGDDPCEPQGEDFSPSPASLPQPGTLSVPPNGGPQFRRPPRRNTSARRTGPLSQREQQQISVASIIAYSRFRWSVRSITTVLGIILCSWTGLTSAESRCKRRAGDTGFPQCAISSKPCGTVGMILLGRNDV